MSQKINLKHYFVIELSSFQLQDLGYTQTSPFYGIITNLYLDHLDQHQDKEEYHRAKTNLFLHSTNGYFLVTEQARSQISENYKQLHIVDKDVVDEYKKKLEYQILGAHMHTNLTQAIKMLEFIYHMNKIKLDNKDLKKKIKSLHTLPYRQDQFHTFRISGGQWGDLDNKEIIFVDDGYATEPDAVKEAVSTFTDSDKSSLQLLITGKDKGGDNQVLIQEIITKKYKITGIYCFSEYGKRLKAELIGAGYPENNLYYMKSFRDFVVDRILQLKSNSNLSAKNYIVFSPGGSSFDEFQNATQRSEWFKKQIKSKF